MLVAAVDGETVLPLREESRQSRLGSGFFSSGVLQAEAIDRTARAVAAFVSEAREEGVSAIRLFATSAARDAQNADELIAAVRKACGLELEIITGEQEAEWAFLGVTTDAALASEPLVLFDIGGGSTEFIVGQGREKHFRESFPLGTVRLMEEMPPSDPPRAAELAAAREWLRTFLVTRVRSRLERDLRWESKLYGRDGVPVRLVGTGGTPTILAKMETGMEEYYRERIESTRLSLERVRWHAERLWSMPLTERQQVAGLPRSRADVILAGVLICEAIMRELGFSELRVSTRGVRFAAVRGGREPRAVRHRA